MQPEYLLFRWFSALSLSQYIYEEKGKLSNRFSMKWLAVDQDNLSRNNYKSNISANERAGRAPTRSWPWNERSLRLGRLGVRRTWPIRVCGGAFPVRRPRPSSGRRLSVFWSWGATAADRLTARRRKKSGKSWTEGITAAGLDGTWDMTRRSNGAPDRRSRIPAHTSIN